MFRFSDCYQGIIVYPRIRRSRLPFGPWLYQNIILVAAHSERHTKQIDEVKADPNFPKK